MRATWVDYGNDPNWTALIKHGITHPFFDCRDPRVTSSYLDSIKAHANIETCGIYTAWNWRPEFSDPVKYVEWTDAELRRINWPGNALVCLDIEKGHNGITDANFAEYAIKALARWRKLRPMRKTWWTMEGMQGGLFSKSLVETVTSLNIRLAPQMFTGDMTPHRHSCVIDLRAAGVDANKIDGMYDGALLPNNWDGFAFTMGRLPQ